MKKAMLLIVLSGMLLGTSCQTLPCSNNLDAGAFGFTMTIPPEFTCVQSIGGGMLGAPYLAVLIYRDTTNSRDLTVLVLQPGQGAGDQQTNPNTTCDAPFNYTPAGNGILFGIEKCTSNDDGSVTYIAGGDLSAGGNVLGVSIGAPADNGLLAILTGVLDSVRLTAAGS